MEMHGDIQSVYSLFASNPLVVKTPDMARVLASFSEDFRAFCICKAIFGDPVIFVKTFYASVGLEELSTTELRSLK